MSRLPRNGRHREYSSLNGQPPDAQPAAVTTIIDQVVASHKRREDESKRHCPCTDCSKWRIHND